jgi:deoxyribodipyrimidine photolyase
MGARALWDEFSDGRIKRYGTLRDFPAVKGVSYLSIHLRFGTTIDSRTGAFRLAKRSGMSGLVS